MSYSIPCIYCGKVSLTYADALKHEALEIELRQIIEALNLTQAYITQKPYNNHIPIWMKMVKKYKSRVKFINKELRLY